MTLLKDNELQATLVDGAQVLNVPAPPGGPNGGWDHKDSSVQPASLDLHVGHIYNPQAQPDESGGLNRPRSGYSLKPGETVVVTTAETLALGADIAGFGFPPSHVSFQGILMTNPGHIDPGYRGRLRFAVINMGSGQYSIRTGDVIMTVLFERLSAAARRDYAARHQNQPAPDLNQEDLDRLSRDFLSIDDRAGAIATNTIKSAALVVPIRVAVITAALALFGTVLSTFGTLSWKEPLAKLEGRIGAAKLEGKVEAISKSIEVEQLKSRVDILERTIQKLQGRPAQP